MKVEGSMHPVILLAQVEGSMYLLIFMAQDWAMRLVAKRSFEFLVFAGWFRVKPLATVWVDFFPLSVAPVGYEPKLGFLRCR